MSEPLLSVCINTRNRFLLLRETLDTLLDQMLPSVEIVVVDGASTDGTETLMRKIAAEHPCVTYYRAPTIIGIDEGYDVAVAQASGTYCWMMTDDDLIEAGALKRLLDEIDKGYDLILVNINCFTRDMSMSLDQRLFTVEEDAEYPTVDDEGFLSVCGTGLSYIGSVVLRRAIWFETEREDYYGSYFAHVAVIFGSRSIDRILLVSHPYIQYRSGNSSWTARSFEIWNFKWPQLVWETASLTDSAKECVVPREPWHRALSILKSRATGEYGLVAFDRFLKGKLQLPKKIVYVLLACIPRTILNFLILIYCLIYKNEGKYTIYNLTISNKYPKIANKVTSLFGVRFPDASLNRL